MEMKKLEIDVLISDKKNPRVDYEEIEELANSLEKNGQLQPLNVEDLKDGTYLIVDGHRRKLAFDILKKRNKKVPKIECVLNNKMTDDERLVKRAAIDAQTKTLYVDERDELWSKIWKKGKYTNKEFADKLGVDSGNVRDFLDRLNLNPKIKRELKKSHGKKFAGILQETLSLPQDRREKVLRYAAKTKKGAMALRQEVRELKTASDSLVDAFTKQEIELNQVVQFKDLKEEKQKLMIEQIKLNKKHMVRLPEIIKDIHKKPKDKKEEQKINAQKFVNRLVEEISKTITQLGLVSDVVDEIKEQKIDEHLSPALKKSISLSLKDLLEEIDNTHELLNDVKNEWR